MSVPSNTTLDDIAAVIGFSATLRLAACYGGSRVHVPVEVSEKNAIAKSIGVQAARKLATEWGDPNEALSVPTLRRVDMALRDARMLGLFREGADCDTVANATGFSTRRVQQLRKDFEADDLLPPSEGAWEKKRRENPLGNPPGKTPRKTPQENPPGKPPEKITKNRPKREVALSEPFAFLAGRRPAVAS